MEHGIGLLGGGEARNSKSPCEFKAGCQSSAGHLPSGKGWRVSSQRGNNQNNFLSTSVRGGLLSPLRAVLRRAWKWCVRVCARTCVCVYSRNLERGEKWSLLTLSYSFQRLTFLILFQFSLSCQDILLAFPPEVQCLSLPTLRIFSCSGLDHIFIFLKIQRNHQWDVSFKTTWDRTDVNGSDEWHSDMSASHLSRIVSMSLYSGWQGSTMERVPAILDPPIPIAWTRLPSSTGQRVTSVTCPGADVAMGKIHQDNGLFAGGSWGPNSKECGGSCVCATALL